MYFLVRPDTLSRRSRCGQIYKEHYACEKPGSFALLMTIEPLTGARLDRIKLQRTKKWYTEFCQALAPPGWTP
jgi:hypothetical protein